MSKGKGWSEVTWQDKWNWRGGWTKGCVRRGAALKRQSAACSISGRRLSCQLLPPALVRRDAIHHQLLFFYLHMSLLGWKRWAICCKCMMNFIKYSQLLLKITGDLQNRNPTCPEQIWHRAKMWNLPEIKSCAGNFRSFMIFFFFWAEHDFIEIMTVTCFIHVLFRQVS